MSLNIRDIRRHDLEFCSELYCDVFSRSPWSERWSEEAAYKRLNHFYRSEGFIGLVAENNGISGFVLGNTEPFLNSSWYYLREICVSHNWQNQGVGTKLLKHLAVTLESHSVKNIYLATDRNIPVAKFYEKNGFLQEAEIGFFYKNI